MPSWLVFLVYAAAFFLAVWVDYEFSRVGWYWRVVAVLVAVAIGLTPPPPQFSGSGFDLVVGAVFTFLFVWGISEAFFRLFHLPHHVARRQA
jgi:hypothetical protein